MTPLSVRDKNYFILYFLNKMFHFSNRDSVPVPVRAEASLPLQTLHKAEQVQPEAEDGGGEGGDPGGPGQWQHSGLSH